jgi:hypothetical protein
MCFMCFGIKTSIFLNLILRLGFGIKIIIFLYLISLAKGQDLLSTLFEIVQETQISVYFNYKITKLFPFFFQKYIYYAVLY